MFAFYIFYYSGILASLLFIVIPHANKTVVYYLFLIKENIEHADEFNMHNLRKNYIKRLNTYLMIFIFITFAANI